jgi:hypothetical protein
VRICKNPGLHHKDTKVFKGFSLCLSAFVVNFRTGQRHAEQTAWASFTAEAQRALRNIQKIRRPLRLCGESHLFDVNHLVDHYIFAGK